MGEGHEMRWGGLAGIGAVIFAVVGRIVMGGMPRLTSPSGVVAMYLADHRAHIMWGTVLYAIAICLFLWFGAALSTAFRRADDTSDAPTVVLAGFILVSAIAFMAVAVFAGMTYTLTEYRALLLFSSAPYATMTIVGTVAGIATALTLAATAVAIARTHVFPMWMAWFAGIVALIRLLAAFTLGITGGVLVPGGWLETYVPGVLSALWVLTASGLLVREHLPTVQMRAPHVMGPGHA
ncbi:hypothetical protein NE236_38385 [Actinoallomurus purpureus]|uniref:hypothetical protein n=1 Tax=Actinoallomurus purpureus TaxID=478114 RepID=UPI0020938757|nr:hypothetical protein [Actinoallomurus purpureus]MCO6010844.1 hypothetical protein [Actinoallomurus purpureus]